MSKKYLAKILARDLNGLNLISLYCHKSILKVSDIKFLKKNKIFLLQFVHTLFWHINCCSISCFQ